MPPTGWSRVRAALKRAGVEDRDIQTSNISLNPEYRYPENQAPQLTGYTASNQLTIRFRDIRNSGKILDALVSAGRQPDQRAEPDDRQARGGARRSARASAIAIGRARAELYARSLGLRVVRVVVGVRKRRLCRPAAGAADADDDARAKRRSTKIEPGEQKLQVTLAMTFELQ